MKKLLLLTLLVMSEMAASQSMGGIVTGRILTRAGAPAAGVRVSALDVPESGVVGRDVSVLAGSAETDSMGRYRLDNLPSGRYFITTGPLDSPTYYPGATSATEATVVAVSASAPASNIDFTITLPVLVTVGGRVIAPSSIPISEQRVIMESLNMENRSSEASVNADGSFQFPRVRPGNYLVRMIQTSVLFVSQPKTIVVTDRDIKEIELTLKETVIVDWNAVVEGGGIVPRLTMSLIPFEGVDQSPSSFTLHGIGYFRHLVPEGDYRVAWSELPGGYRIKSITSGATDVLAHALKVTAANEPSIVVTLGVSSPPPWVKVSGRVTGGTNRVPSIASLRVSLTGDTTARPIPDAPVSADGSFEFPMVLPGQYVARVNAGDGRDFHRPAPLMVPFSVFVPSQDVSGLQIAIPNVKTITVRVTVEGNAEAPREMSFRFAHTSGGPEITVDAELQPDGTFKVDAHEGVNRIMLHALPGFRVRQMKYKSVDLHADPVTIAATDSDDLLVTLTPFVPQ